MTKDKILAALLTLNKDELRAIKAAADALIGEGGGGTLTSKEMLLLDAVTATVGPFGLSQARAKVFKQHSPIMIKFIDDECRGDCINRSRRLGIMRFMCGLIRADLKKRGVPVTPGMLLCNLSRIQDVFEESFPDYISHGLVGLAVTHAVRS